MSADGSLHLDLGRELVVDLFAGGGGASMGIARAYREPDVAINHNPVAIAVHRANHPQTEHYTCDVFEVDPVAATRGRPVAILWASPDCRHHSKAKGGKPRSKKIRGLAWVVTKWAAAVRPRLIHLENVEEFADWGPLLSDGSPCKARKGTTFRRWVRQLENLGYKVEWRERIAANAGAPTIRKRLYIIARRDGRPIVWPEPTHAKAPTGKLLPWRTAAECIDWTVAGKSIFDRPRPLADNTQKRIAKGLWRYVLDCAAPFIVPLRGTSAAHTSVHSVDDPVSTVSAGGTHHALVAAHLTHLTHHGERSGNSCAEPLRTVTGAHRGELALVGACMTAFGQNAIGHDLRDPADTVLAGAPRYGIVTAYMSQCSGGPNGHISLGHPATAPVSTITSSGSHQQVVTAYLVKYYGTDQDPQMREPLHTVTTKDRFGIVQSIQVPADILADEHRARAKQCAAFLHHWLPQHFPEAFDMILIGGYVLVDITLRMLMPRELARAMGWPDDYLIEWGLFVDEANPNGEWRPITKTDQVRLIGNGVCPDEAEALIRANAADLIKLYETMAA